MCNWPEFVCLASVCVVHVLSAARYSYGKVFVPARRPIIGGGMKLKAAITSLGLVLGLAFVASQAVVAQENEFPQPAPPKEVTVTEIPGVVAAGAKWQLIWGQNNNADGLVATADGGILFGQEQ